MVLLRLRLSVLRDALVPRDRCLTSSGNGMRMFYDVSINLNQNHTQDWSVDPIGGGSEEVCVRFSRRRRCRDRQAKMGIGCDWNVYDVHCLLP